MVVAGGLHRDCRVSWAVNTVPCPIHHPGDSKCLGTARLVPAGAMMPGVRCFIPSPFPSAIYHYGQLHHYNRIILSGIKFAAWEKILIASGVRKWELECFVNGKWELFSGKVR